MTRISVRVSAELRDKIKGFPDINWSEVVRKAIEKRVATETARRKKDRAAILAAGREINKIHERLTEQHGTIDYDSSQTIRHWRNHRYSELGTETVLL